MPDSIFGLDRGPGGDTMTPDDLVMRSETQPLNWSEFVSEEASLGALSGPGFGTIEQRNIINQGRGTVLPSTPAGLAGLRAGSAVPETDEQIRARGDEPLTADQYKASGLERPGSGFDYDPRMTRNRAQAIADYVDHKSFEQQRVDRYGHPWLGKALEFAGGAFDPGNFIPVLGPEVRAAAAARWGITSGLARDVMGSAADAALNAGLMQGVQSRLVHDDVQWQDVISQGAMGALFGGAIGAIGHGIGAFRANRLEAATALANDRALADINTTMEARGALDAAMTQVANSEPVVLAPEHQALVERAAADPLVEHEHLVQEVQKDPQIAAALEAMKAIPETYKRDNYGTPEYEQNRVFDFNGEKVVGYDAAVARLTDEAGRFSNGPVATDKRVAIVLGPPAAGKSTLAERLAKEMNAAILDPDDAKAVLPEFQGGIGAHAVHEESSRLAERVFVSLAHEGKNIVYPVVGSHESSVAEKIARFKKRGYTVDVVNMRVPAEEAFRRMIGRYKATGRLIPPDYTLSVGNKPTEVYHTLKAKGAADGFTEVSGLGAQGEPHPIVGGEGYVRGVLDAAGHPVLGDVGGNGTSPLHGGDGRVGPEGRGGREGQGQVNIQPRPEPGPDPQLKQAEAKVGKPQNLKDLAAEHKVDPETGAYPEQLDVKQLLEEGRVDAADQAALKQADEDFETGKAYADGLMSAFTCVAAAA
jgi:predicted ABC-type ATPase